MAINTQQSNGNIRTKEINNYRDHPAKYRLNLKISLLLTVEVSCAVSTVGNALLAVIAV